MLGACGWLGIVLGLSSTESNMWLGRVTLLGMLTLGLTGCLGPTFQSEGKRLESGPAWLHKRSGVSGVVPLPYVLEALRKLEVLDQWPDRPSPVDLVVDCKSDLEVGALLGVVEVATGWTYDPGLRSFVMGQATHTIDGPDSAGRPQAVDRLSPMARPMVALGIRFVRVNGNVSMEEISAGAKYVEFWGSGPMGTVLAWDQVTERSFDNGVVDPANPSQTVVRTNRVVVPAGLQVQALTSRIVGGMARVDGKLSVSAFTGISVDRVQVGIPLQADIPRFKWSKVYRSTGLDASASASFKGLGLDLTAGADNVEVWVRVD